MVPQLSGKEMGKKNIFAGSAFNSSTRVHVLSNIKIIIRMVMSMADFSTQKVSIYLSCYKFMLHVEPHQDYYILLESFTLTNVITPYNVVHNICRNNAQAHII